MSVKDSGQSTTFNPKKEILFKKPLPPTYLNGNERYKKGSKYLIRSCLNRNSLHVFDHTDQTIHRMAIDVEHIEYDSMPKTDFEYKVADIDEFCKKYQKKEVPHENMSFAIFNVTGNDETNEYNENFRILVPSKRDGYKEDANGKVQFVNYSSKTEYQSEYGAEIMTKDELIREWCEMFFRPNTVTERSTCIFNIV